MIEVCEFRTERLMLEGWHRAQNNAEDLANAIVAILTEPVTRSLPDSWQGEYSMARAQRWIEERDTEGTTLLVCEKVTGSVVGLMILTEVAAEVDKDRIEVRLGYLIAETAWGRGFASEMIAGLVSWCSSRSDIHSIAGGVATDNPASARVLEKNGFETAPEADASASEAIYRRVLR